MGGISNNVERLDQFSITHSKKNPYEKCSVDLSDAQKLDKIFETKTEQHHSQGFLFIIAAFYTQNQFPSLKSDTDIWTELSSRSYFTFLLTAHAQSFEKRMTKINRIER